MVLVDVADNTTTAPGNATVVEVGSAISFQPMYSAATGALAFTEADSEPKCKCTHGAKPSG